MLAAEAIQIHMNTEHDNRTSGTTAQWRHLYNVINEWKQVERPQGGKKISSFIGRAGLYKGIWHLRSNRKMLLTLITKA